MRICISVLSGFLLAATLAAPVGAAEEEEVENPAPKKLFAEEQWYLDALGEPRPFTGVLRKAKLPEVGFGRMNPYRLEMTGSVREVYVGGELKLLDDFVGRRVTIVGKSVDLSVEGREHAEIWPASIAVAAPGEVPAEEAEPPFKILASAPLANFQGEEKVARAIQTQAEFTLAFGEREKDVLAKLKREAIDFEKETVLWIQAGMQANPGYRTAIEEIVAGEGDAVVVRWKLHPPGDGFFAQVLVNPGTVAVVPRLPGEVSFEQREAKEQAPSPRRGNLQPRKE